MKRLVFLLALACMACSSQAASPHMTLASEVTWTERGDYFGGFSGFVLEPDGKNFLSISDRGAWVRGQLERDTDGDLTGVALTDHGRLHEVSGRPLATDDANAEAIVLDMDGRAYVSFEGFHRVRRFADIDGPAAKVPSHPDFAHLQNNSGLEALAIDGAGQIYAIPERSGALTRPFPVYRLTGNRWEKALSLRRDGPFLVSDATFGPDGRFYLLERDFEWLGGFRTRVRRFDLGPKGFENEETLLQTRFGELDNMEGIQVWRDPQGSLRVLLMSDDNFFPLQRTMFAEYVVSGE